MMKLPPGSMSPISNEWITAPVYLTETSCLLRSIFHKWRVILLQIVYTLKYRIYLIMQ